MAATAFEAGSLIFQVQQASNVHRDVRYAYLWMRDNSSENEESPKSYEQEKPFARVNKDTSLTAKRDASAAQLMEKVKRRGGGEVAEGRK